MNTIDRVSKFGLAPLICVEFPEYCTGGNLPEPFPEGHVPHFVYGGGYGDNGMVGYNPTTVTNALNTEPFPTQCTGGFILHDGRCVDPATVASSAVVMPVNGLNNLWLKVQQFAKDNPVIATAGLGLLVYLITKKN